MTLERNQQKQQGFTIVELLIVIVVIGILAAITIVSYNGIQSRAKSATVQSDLDNASKQLEVYKLTTSSSDQYPPDTTTAGLKASTGTTYAYYYNATANTYCLTGTNTGISYYIATGTPLQNGTCLISNGLVGWWNLNGSVNDTSGNNNNGTNNGATATTGQNGQVNGAYSFNGTSSLISLPNAAAISGNNPYTLSAWIQPTDITISNHGILGWGAWGTINGVTAFRTQNEGGINGLRMYWWNNDLAGSAPSLADGRWHHVLTEFDGSTRSIYVDGALIASDNPPVHNAVAADVNIGRTDGAEYFVGSIDDVRIYNRALSASEVQALHAAGAQ